MTCLVRKTLSAGGQMPVFGAGFRPFFLMAGVVAAVQIPLWLALVVAGVGNDLPYAPGLWHGHEMLFGFGGAALAGFLLTAVPNWTGVPTPTGWRLGMLAGLWLAARLAFLAGGHVPLLVPVVLDAAFLPTLGAVLAIPLIRAGKPRNAVFLVLLAAMSGANILVLADMAGWAAWGRNGLYLALFLLITMIGMVGGRIIPGFTQNGLRMAGIAWTVPSRPWIDRLSIAALALSAVAQAVEPGGFAAGLICLVAGGLNLLRLAGWNGWATRSIPLLWVLHVGYGWVVAGLLLLGAASLAPDLVLVDQGVHALTSGAIGTMVLGVMSRAALGHSGRPLTPSRLTVAAYVLVQVAALARVIGGMGGDAGLMLAGAAWTLAFLLFTIAYAPICLSPRADNRAG